MKHRTFIALDLPENIKAEILTLQKQLDQLKLPVNWQESDKLHLTLNFLGWLTDEQVYQVKDLVNQSVKNFRKFELTPMFLETLYSRHDPTIIYLSIGGEVNELAELQKFLSNSLNEINIPQPRKFLPHITLGEFKRTDPTTTKRFMDIISNYEISKLSPFTVENIALYEHYRDSAHYQKLATFPLSTP